MLLLLHVLIALMSLVYITWLLVYPAKSKFKTAYGLIALTLISGTGLVLLMHAPVVKACMSGLVYLSLASAGIMLAHYRLAKENISSDI